jgi:hypothetical protein
MVIAVLIATSLIQFFGGSMFYVRDTLKGKSKPNRMTFLIWSVGPLIGVVAGIAAGAAWWALLPVLVGGLGPLAILLSSFVNPNAYWKLGILDYTCGALAILALIFWRTTSDPAVAIAFSIAADALASLPTIIKSWRFPETETGFTYFVAFCNVGLGLLLAPTHSFVQIGFLTYLFLCDAILTIAANRPWLLRTLRIRYC